MTVLFDPEDIVRQSFSHIRAQLDLRAHDPAIVPVIERVIHAAGMLDLVDDIVYSDDFVAAGTAALLQRRIVLCDSRMVAAGLTRTSLLQSDQIHVMIDHADVAEHASVCRTTRSAAAIDIWQERLHDAIIVIGNAPTALFRLLDLMSAAALMPAAVIGIPVGFIGAEASKEALIARTLPVPYFTVRGTRGGSAMAAAALNALVRIANCQDNAPSPPGPPGS